MYFTDAQSRFLDNTASNAEIPRELIEATFRFRNAMSKTSIDNLDEARDDFERQVDDLVS